MTLCAFIFLCSRFAVGVLYGEAFLPLVPALQILLLGVVALSLGSPISSYFTLKLGKPEIPLVLASVSAAICIATAVVLVPHVGLIGAAIASTIAYIAGQSLGIAYFLRRARISARDTLVPTRDDLRTYADFSLRVIRDCMHFFRRVSIPQASSLGDPTITAAPHASSTPGLRCRSHNWRYRVLRNYRTRRHKNRNNTSARGDRRAPS